jgi:3-deoxy-D-manno-octulosonic acid kinase
MSENLSEKIALESQFKIKKTGDSYILYDADIIADPSLQLFDRDYHTNQSPQQNNSSSESATEPGIGRARVSYITCEDKIWVLKHYYRGGAVASVLKDQYLGFDIERSRAFREWRLLKKMRDLALPVPDAVAAQVKKSLFYYRADLITEKIENSQTLADVLEKKKISDELWQKIGACIKTFHQHDIYHADLNARNILLTESDDVYLIDFDNSAFRVDSPSWKMANLSRLKRSLLKFRKNIASFNFDEDNWRSLLAGYK